MFGVVIDNLEEPASGWGFIQWYEGGYIRVHTQIDRCHLIFFHYVISCFDPTHPKKRTLRSFVECLLYTQWGEKHAPPSARIIVTFNRGTGIDFCMSINDLVDHEYLVEMESNAKLKDKIHKLYILSVYEI
jgi:hypothetical protein